MMVIKRTGLIILAISFLLMSANTFADSKPEKLKAHKCTSLCEAGKHTYKHGEKGHNCTEACAMKTSDKKDDACTGECTGNCSGDCKGESKADAKCSDTKSVNKSCCSDGSNKSK